MPRLPDRRMLRLARERRPRSTLLGRLDMRLLLLMRTRGHDRRVERGVGLVAGMGEWGAIWCGSGLVAAAFDPGRRGRWLVAAAIAPLSIPLNYAVKVAARRARPVLPELPALGTAPSALSFPSAHATSSFAAATAMARIAPAAGATLYPAAAMMALTRPYLGMHYPSDVIVGAILGMALGRLVPGLDGPLEPEGSSPAPAA